MGNPRGSFIGKYKAFQFLLHSHQHIFTVPQRFIFRVFQKLKADKSLLNLFRMKSF